VGGAPKEKKPGTPMGITGKIERDLVWERGKYPREQPGKGIRKKRLTKKTRDNKGFKLKRGVSKELRV